MLGATRWLFGGLQATATVLALVLAAVAQGKPARDLDRGGFDRLMADTAVYLDPQTTGALRKLIETR